MSTYISVGEFKGRKLRAPFNDRPTQQKVRQALFNILWDEIPGSKVLDLCCGTGSFGIEALSLGAEFVSFVDINIKPVKENTAFLDSKKYECVRSRSQSFICRSTHQYDIIFFDPPWRDQGTYEDTLSNLLSQNVLSEPGIMIIEHHKKYDISHLIDDVFQVDTRQYADAALEICRR